MTALPGRRILLSVLVTCLSLLLGLTLLVCLLSGSCRLSLMLRVLLVVYLVSLMSGLVGAWYRIRSRVSVLLGLGFFLTFLVAFGLDEGGG